MSCTVPRNNLKWNNYLYKLTISVFTFDIHASYCLLRPSLIQMFFEDQVSRELYTNQWPSSRFSPSRKQRQSRSKNPTTQQAMRLRGVSCLATRRDSSTCLIPLPPNALPRTYHCLSHTHFVIHYLPNQLYFTWWKYPTYIAILPASFLPH